MLCCFLPYNANQPYLYIYYLPLGLPWWLRLWRICLQCGRSGFHSWVGKSPWRRAFLPGESPWTEEPGGLQSTVHWVTKSDTTEQLKTAQHLPLDLPSLLAFPPFRLSYPSQSSQSTRLGLPVLYSSFSPAIYFTHGSVYMSMLLLPFIPLLNISSIFKCLYIWLYSFT